MRKRAIYFLLFLLISSCIEPYEFVVKAIDPVLVVEAYISDKSFNKTISYPSDGRYFTVKLSVTGDVINLRPKMVSGAAVWLVSDQEEEWEYIESEPVDNPGVYSLFDDDFEAQANVKYKLHISQPGEGSYESTWEILPSPETPVMGEISFTETEIQTYIVELGKNVIKTIKGITTDIHVPENELREPMFYRWKYTPIWIYKAPISFVSDPGHICWATDVNYLKDYVLQIDNAGGYRKDLFFMPTVRNERIFEDFSVLISQHAMTEQHYFFWEEMQEQTQGGAIFDSPPYNLQTNMLSLSGSSNAVGYFGVVREQAKRWYFNKNDLSYFVPNTLLRDCTVPDQDQAPECFDCREYSFGKTSTAKPVWWR